MKISAQNDIKEIAVDTRLTTRNLLFDEDTDSDKKITINDSRVHGTERGDKRFVFLSINNSKYEIIGTYHLSNLLQELQLLQEAGHDTASIRFDRIYERPVDRISRCIKDFYWDGLTRHIDEEGLISIMKDEKTSSMDGAHYLYLPYADELAVRYFNDINRSHPEWNLHVIQLPEKLGADRLEELSIHPGILSLKLIQKSDGSISGLPFVVPGGRFNEMYGWDSYFIVLGLLHDGKIALAKSIVENFLYEIDHYGAVLNANRSYYLTRLQPPFLTSMGIACAKNIKGDSARHRWFQPLLMAAIREYRDVWMSPYRLTSCGLNRYYDTGEGIPPEVEPGHYDPILLQYAKKHGLSVKEFEKKYRAHLIKEPELDRFFVNDRAMRESGHDTSYRLLNRCADVVTVDLNSLLYKIEKDIAEIIKKEFSGSFLMPDGRIETSTEWFKQAEKRKNLINKYLWDQEQGAFFDYDFVKKKKTYYMSATAFYPLWAGLATSDQAQLLVKKALPSIEMPGGVAGSTEKSRGPITKVHPLRQWDYPFGWAPHQILIWQGLQNYGYEDIAGRLAYRWLFTITLNAYQFNGTIPEKFDVVNRSNEVFAEYGNIGTKFSYITKEGFGWTNASYQLGLDVLSDSMRTCLDQLIPPEWIYEIKSQ